MGSKILKDSNKKFYGSQKPENNVKDCAGHRKGASCPVTNNICNRVDNVGVASIETNSKNYNHIGISAPPTQI